MGHRAVATTLLFAGLIAGAALATGCNSDEGPAPTSTFSGPIEPARPTVSSDAGGVTSTPSATVANSVIVSDPVLPTTTEAGRTPPVLVINGPAQVDLTTAP